VAFPGQVGCVIIVVVVVAAAMGRKRERTLS